LRHAEPQRSSFCKQILPKSPPFRAVNSCHDQTLAKNGIEIHLHVITAGKDVDLLTVTIWLQSEWRIVRQRQQFLAKLPMNNSGNWINGDPLVTPPSPQWPGDKSYLKLIPWVRRMLGDHICFSLLLPGSYNPAQIDEAITLFPEAAEILRDDPKRGLVEIKENGVLMPRANF
jgi:hypothetical protein